MTDKEKIAKALKTKAYEIGYKAYMGGLTEDSNPFKDEFDRLCWSLGMADAKYDKPNL